MAEQTNSSPKPKHRGAPDLPDHLAKELEDDQPPTKLGVEESKTKDATDDSKTEAAVDDIVRHESDDLLAVQDAAADDSVKPSNKRWWRSKKFWWITCLSVAAIAAAVMAIPTSRYWVLNHLGVRASASVEVVDATTGQPLKDVEVTIGDTSTKTNGSGLATLTNLLLGPTNLDVERIAFAEVHTHVTIGWGSNPLDKVELQATGAQYEISVTDYLSGKPIAGVEASVDQASAISDKDGKAILTLDPDANASTVSVSITASGYRNETLELNLKSADPVSVVLVPSNKTVFISHESGRYDLYAMDIDGQNRRLLLAGTGNETSNITLVVSPTGDRAALVSTRDTTLGSDGVPLNTLTLVDVNSGSSVALDRGQQLQVVDWVGTRLVYQMISPTAAVDAADRQRIISYGYSDDKRLQLAVANEFGSIAAAQGAIYYASPTTDKAAAALFKIKPDGSGKQTVLEKEIWSILRTDYNTLSIQTPDDWQALDLAKGQLSAVSQPANLTSRIYIDNLQAPGSLWVTQGTLNRYDPAAAKDLPIKTQSGLAYPVRWLTGTAAIYRVANTAETADYAISIDGGEARKLGNVFGAHGFPASY